jgi:predicted GNAT family N-acyltransferase
MQLNPTLGGVWLDKFDLLDSARHWAVYSTGVDGSLEIVASARLTLHRPEDQDEYRDVALWNQRKLPVVYPICDMGRLVVKKEWRKRGIAQELNRIRIEYAKQWGAKMIIVTASAENARLLERIGFTDIGERIEFADRPGVAFSALQLVL